MARTARNSDEKCTSLLSPRCTIAEASPLLGSRSRTRQALRGKMKMARPLTEARHLD